MHIISILISKIFLKIIQEKITMWCVKGVLFLINVHTNTTSNVHFENVNNVILNINCISKGQDLRKISWMAAIFKLVRAIYWYKPLILIS